MKNLIGFLVFVIGLGSITAQSFNKIYQTLPNQVQRYSYSDTLKILAVMVEFQEDKYDATIGTGKFGSHYTKSYGDTILDPLPHNAEYFSDHLLFAKNYFSKVSKGKLNIAYKVLPEVITVSKTMREYVPGYKSKDLTPLGKFSEEVWKLADQKFSNVKFSEYDLFVIFHAGVSSSLDLGTFSIDRNMPSLYLSNASLKTIFGNNFSGFHTKNGIIKNSLIMPETESREQTFIDNSVGLVQITINGGLVANIGSHLGLPDLFNTETGKSAIGRFGLMDGQAIVANNGMFPPELSPWEKIYLGWEEPKEISIKGGKINISARQTAALNDTTLLKVPISSKEYFLIENRQQDAKNDGLILTIKKRNQIYKKTIQKDTSGLFNFQPTDIKGGVVIDVDEFDAAVPGNGIVIWHIDENIINSTIAENKINADLYKKGVDVEEADGIQDIGETFSSVFGAFIGEGDKYDFWHKGNKAKLYKNSFSPGSKPNTNSNNNENSLVSITSFSSLGNKMSFQVSKESDFLRLVSSRSLNLGISTRMLSANQSSKNSHFILINNSELFVYDLAGNLINNQKNFSDVQPIVFENNDVFYVIGYKNRYGINIYSLQQNGISSFKSVKFFALEGVQLLLSKNNTEPKLILGLPGTYSLNETSIFSISLSELLALELTFPKPFPWKYQLFSFNEKILGFANNENYLTIFTDIKIYYFDLDSRRIITQTPVSPGIVHAVSTIDKDGNYFTVALTVSNRFVIIKNGNVINNIFASTKNSLSKFIIGDLFQDGQNYIIYKDGNSLHAINSNGMLAKNFPIVLSQEIYNEPLLCDYNKDGKNDLIVQSANGNTFLITPNQSKINGIIPFVNSLAIDPKIIIVSRQNNDGKIIPHLISIDQKDMNIFQFNSEQGETVWAGEFPNSYNNYFIKAPNSKNAVPDFFPTAKAYNWPNPVYGSSTKIRYYVSENSTATVKIFDLAGELVTTLTGNAVGGMDNEINWEVEKVQSGVYYANLEVISSSGKSANKIIKIAVIK
ncbi:MAG: FG-GAP repeat protein [Ignavibacteria bacterium]|nr:MAG: FG-GAP repeat protein [Ignavibacteria bacterium]KAF0161987.1 MAG: FG-GAP repeat protein [Ignavibacteria bacterium]